MTDQQTVIPSPRTHGRSEHRSARKFPWTFDDAGLPFGLPAELPETLPGELPEVLPGMRV